MKSSRKIIAFITAMAAAFSCGACTGGGSSSDTPKKKLAPIEDLADYSAYSLKTWLKPFWYTRKFITKRLCSWERTMKQGFCTTPKI